MKYCFDRYLHNHSSLKEEYQRSNSIWDEVENTINSINGCDNFFFKFQYQDKYNLNKGVDVLFQCRRFLMYSYAFIFYVEEDNRVYIIETNLDDLEAQTDKLSVYLEKYFARTDDEDSLETAAESLETEAELLETEAEIRAKIGHCAA